VGEQRGAERPRERILFLCVHNSARSQMAEAMLRAWAGDRYEAHSAGNEATQVRPEAIAVMDELGIDLRGQRSKNVAEFLGQPMDWAITTCDENQEACPVFPAASHHEFWPFDDPSKATGSEEERLATFRRVRDELAVRIRDFAARDTLASPTKR
jgi:arsenate reductase